MKKIHRRTFAKKAASMSLALTTAPYIFGKNSSWKGANDRLNVAVVGIHGMGQNHIKSYNAIDNVRVTAICDVDESLFDERVKKHFTDLDIPKPKIYTDLRKLFDDKSIDAVSIVTPNHWHTLASIWAIQAGKHVSVEKPCCHTFHEGQKLLEAAKKYNVIVQDGAEQRSNPCAKSMAEYLHGGKLGEVYYGKALCYKRRDTIGKAPNESIPKGVHYDLWMGPAPKKPFSQNRFHYNWHWQWDYGNGDMGNQGVHEMDIARWGMNVGLPTKITSTGAHFMFEDDQETPNTQISTFEFDNNQGTGDKKKMLVFEVRHWDHNLEGFGGRKKDDAAGGYMTSSANTVGNIFMGSKGYMLKNVDRWETFHGKERTPGQTGGGLGNNYLNFIEAIKNNDPQHLNAKIEDGVLSCSLIHLANISYRLGRSLEFDPLVKEFKNDTEANAMLTKIYRTPYAIPQHI